MKKQLVLATLVLTGALVLSGCGGGGSKSATKAGGKILTIELGPEVESIDPALNTTNDGANYLTYLFDNLLRIDKEGKVAPSLAEKYEVSEDGLTWTFHLRDGLKWSDGSDLTANDFVYSWQRMIDPEVAAPYAEITLGMLEGYEEAIGKPDADGNPTIDPDVTKLGVEATDDKTLVVHMSSPTPYFDKLATFAALSPVKKDVVDANPDGWTLDPKTYISSGPFKLTEWKSGSYLMLEKNENYLNNTLDEFKDSRVRQALSLALDRKYISETITAGTYTPASGFVSAGTSDWDGSLWADNITDPSVYINVDDFAGNLAKAKELLAEAGHPNGEGLPTLTYSTNDSAYHKKIAEYLQQAWKELGVNVEVNIVEWKSFTPQRRSGNYQIARDGWVMDYNDPSNILQLTQTGNGNNSSKYSNPEYDALLEKAAKEVDPQTRFGYFHQAEEMLMRDMGVTPLLYYNEMYLQSDKVKDSYHTADGIYHFEYADIAE